MVKLGTDVRVAILAWKGSSALRSSITWPSLFTGRDLGQERCWWGLTCPWRPLYFLLLGLEGQEGFELQGEMGKSYGSVLVSSLRFEASAFKREVTFPDVGGWDPMPKISCFFLMCLHLGDIWFAKKTLSSTKIALPYYTQNLYRCWVITWSHHRMQRTFHNRKPQWLILCSRVCWKEQGVIWEGEKNLEFHLNSGMIMWLEGQNKNLQPYFVFRVHQQRLHETLIWWLRAPRLQGPWVYFAAGLLGFGIKTYA